ncbi:DUF6538 domain-containing protein [Rhizobium leguminosarum]
MLNGYWYCRARAKDLHRLCEEREKWIALGTKDEEEAKAKSHLVAAKSYVSMRRSGRSTQPFSANSR